MTGRQLDPDPIVSRNAGLIEAEVHGEIVGLHVDNGICYGFNTTASQIWRLLAEPRRLSDLVARLVEHHEVDPPQCRRDVLALLNDLGADHLVSLSSVDSPHH